MLEFHGLPPNARTAYILAMLWCCAIGAFALAGGYGLALALLFAAGFLELSYNSMAQSLIQIHAPAEIRGRVIGLYITFSQGLRAISGVTVGAGAELMNVHWSLALCAMAMFTVVSVLLVFSGRGERREAGFTLLDRSRFGVDAS